MEKHAFEFLKEDYPKIEKDCYELEQSIFFKNYRNALVTARIVCEDIAKELLESKGLDDIYTKQFDRIETLKKIEILKDSSTEEYIFNRVNELGNYAAHGSLEEIEEKEGATKEEFVDWSHKAVYSLANWFYKIENENYRSKEYPGIIFKEEFLTEEEKLENPKIESRKKENILIDREKENIRYCRFCKTELKKEDKYCTECGKPVEPEFVPCYNCGELINKDAEICPHCSHYLKLDENNTAYYCESCGVKLDVGSLYCTHCGHKIYNTDNEPQTDWKKIINHFKDKFRKKLN